MKVRIGFSRTNAFLSRTIRWFTRSNISHSYIKFYDDFLGVSLIIHADFPGVVIIPESKFKINNIPIEEYEIDDNRLGDSIRKNMRLIGKKYDFLNLFGWLPVIVFKSWFKRKIKNPLDDPKRLICVDFCLHIINEAELTMLPYNTLTQKDFRKWCDDNCEKLGWTKIILDNQNTMVDNVKIALKIKEPEKKDNWNENS